MTRPFVPNGTVEGDWSQLRHGLNVLDVRARHFVWVSRHLYDGEGRVRLIGVVFAHERRARPTRLGYPSKLIQSTFSESFVAGG